MNLIELTAERFDHQAKGGATLPIVMSCRALDGSLYDVFVKCSSAQCSVGALVREVVGGLLAQHVGINVPMIALVKIPQDLLDQIKGVSPDVAIRLAESVQPAAGSVYLGPSFRICGNAAPIIELDLADAAGEIWAFDQLTVNPDRNRVKPNCLTDGRSLAAIDHEKSLNVYGMGFLFLPPWDKSWTPDVNHLFHDVVTASGVKKEKLQEQWAAVSEQVIAEIFSKIPVEWEEEEVKKSVHEYLVSLNHQMDAALTNLSKVAA